MNFDWDESKRISNLRKHGIDFSNTINVFDGEERFITLGLLQGQVIVIVHRESEDYIQIISARKATKYEQQNYFEQI